MPVPHGNVGVKPWHAVTAEEVTKVRDCILNYASINGLPQPSAPRGHNDAAPTYLPSVSIIIIAQHAYRDQAPKIKNEPSLFRFCLLTTNPK